MRNIFKLNAFAGLLLCVFLQQAALYASAAEKVLQIDVCQPEQKTASFSVGKAHDWFIRCRIPNNREELSDLTVIQTLSPGLTLETDSIRVTLIPSAGTQQVFQMGEQYDLTAGSVFVENGTADRICISLTPEGLSRLFETGKAFPELRISYRAKINSGAAVGMQLIGTAQLNLTDAAGEKTVFLSDKAAVGTGGVQLRLTDHAGNPLSGGRFMLAREATREETADPVVTTELLDTGEEIIAVIYETFYSTQTMDTGKTDTAVTDKNGTTGIFGLAYGTYYLVQTESSRSNLLPAKPVRIVIDEASHLTASDGWEDGNGHRVDNTVRIVNSGIVMPQTGGPGTRIYTLSGMAVILSACLLLWLNRKREIHI